jgi:hypothetical protein
MIPYKLATKLGESPARTVYICSTPTAPIGNVVTILGSVDSTGGIVAKSVGPTGTIVVAVPAIVVLHAPTKNRLIKITAACWIAFVLLVIKANNRRKDL